MKKVIFLLVGFFLSLWPLASQQMIIPLDGADWTIRNPHDAVDLPGNVPGNIFTDLLQSRLIPDPYLGANELYVQWVSDRMWIYEKEIKIDDPVFTRMEVQELVLDRVDGYATVYWNGHEIGKCNNSFQPFHFDLRDKIEDVNRLRIVFDNTHYVERQKEKARIKLPGGSRVYTRKPAFHYGWDWGPTLNGVGIGSASLQAWEGIEVVSSFPEVDTLVNGVLYGTAVINVRSAVSAYLSLNILFDGETTISGHSVKVHPGLQEIRIPFVLKEPRMWWTWDLGNPYLYEIKLEMEYMSDSPVIRLYAHDHDTQWGLRQISLVTEKDSIGESFMFLLNGVPVFARGANYIPQDLFQNRVTDEDYNYLLTQARASNMNLLRVWGGGIYETEKFYSLCDSLGILVWQDFMFACAMYPGDEDFYENVKSEAEYQVRRLASHPSLSLWCGNNENAEGWARWGWQEAYSEGERVEIAEDYYRLFHEILPGIVASISPSLPYWPSSPEWGRGDERFDKEGDAHDWGVWHDGMPFSRFEDRIPRFMSEYGFQSWPSYEVVKSFAMPDQGELAYDVHQKHSRGFDIMEEYRKRNFSSPLNLLDTIYISQLVQARGMVIGAEAHRLARPYCMGSLYWQFNDCWPVISWSGIDQKGYWKAMQAYIKQAFEPVMFTLKSRQDTLEIWGVNDTRKSIEDSLVISWWVDGSRRLKQSVIFAELEAGEAARIESFPTFGLPSGLDTTSLMITLAYNDDPRVFLVVRPVNYTGIHAPLEWICEENGDEFELELYSEAVHTSIYLPPEILIEQKDNFPTVLPDRPVYMKVKSCPEYMRSFPFNVIRRSGFGAP